MNLILERLLFDRLDERFYAWLCEPEQADLEERLYWHLVMNDYVPLERAAR